MIEIISAFGDAVRNFSGQVYDHFYAIISSRFAPLFVLVFVTAPILTSCATTNSPEENIARPPDSYPAIPFKDPNILGEPRGPVASTFGVASGTISTSDVVPIDKLADINAAIVCLANKQSVYGMARANSNVRAAPAAGACRVGRAPRGRLVRIDSIYDTNGTTPIVSISGVTAPTAIVGRLDEMELGFEEDVRPIFDRSCTACHNNVAKQGGLQTNDYDALMSGSTNGIVVVPGSSSKSWLWDQIRVGTMPLNGELPDNEKAIIERWIESGAKRNRPPAPTPTLPTRSADASLWLQISASDVDVAPNNRCNQEVASPQTMVNNQLIDLLTCGTVPSEAQADLVRAELAPEPTSTVPSIATPTATYFPPVAAALPTATYFPPVAAATSAAVPAAAPAATAAPAPQPVSSGEGVSVAALGLPAPSDSDPFFIPRGGFCIGQKQTRLQDNRSITAMSFAPDGRLFLALDTVPVGEKVDQIILTDAYHPSRSIAVFDSYSDGGFNEIMKESSRITGLAYYQGALYVSRSGEIGQIPDGGQYKKLAGGFAVEGRLWHANNGLVIQGGNLYVSAGGIRDGWSDGPIQGMGEAGAQNVVSGGNPYSARLVRAPLSQLLSSRSINSFQTAARGFRNPYGLAASPDGRLWITDNGATNVPENISAGDEVNVFDPRQIPLGTAESGTPYFGFPLALTGANAGWKAPVIDMPNSAAPTGATWAYNTLFYAQYGREPGLYRLGRDSSGRTIAERIMMGWPIVALATSPDGSLWVGSATGRLYRMTPGC